MRKVMVICGLLTVFASVALVGCRHDDASQRADPAERAPGDGMALSLSWHPSDDLSGLSAAGLAALSRMPLSLVMAGDIRATPANQVGRNEQDATPKFVTTSDDVFGFVVAHLADILRSRGVQVEAAGAPRVIELKLVRYYVVESGTYSAEVRLNVALKDSGGKLLWQGPVIGTSHRWGRSFEESNYQESLSNALVDAVKNLLGTPAFVQAASSS